MTRLAHTITQLFVLLANSQTWARESGSHVVAKFIRTDPTLRVRWITLIVRYVPCKKAWLCTPRVLSCVGEAYSPLSLCRNYGTDRNAFCPLSMFSSFLRQHVYHDHFGKIDSWIHLKVFGMKMSQHLTGWMNYNQSPASVNRTFDKELVDFRKSSLSNICSCPITFPGSWDGFGGYDVSFELI